MYNYRKLFNNTRDLSDDEIKNLEAAYKASCERWEPGYKKGIKAYAKIAGEVQETPVETPAEKPAIEEPVVETSAKEPVVENPTKVPAEKSTATSE